MEEQPIQQTVCRSVFKSGENTTKSEFTKKWIGLINQLEKNRELTVGSLPEETGI